MQLDDELIKKLYLQDSLSGHDIAKQIGVSSCAIYKRLKAWGITKSIEEIDRTTHYVNHDAFEKLTEESLYWGGFLAADGYIYIAPHGNPVIGISIKETDREHLENFRAYVGSGDRAISNIGKGCVSYRIPSAKMSSDLKRFGVVPRKTFTIKVDDREVAVSPHFWRGVVDGDGHINKTRKAICLVSASEAFANQYQEFVRGIGSDCGIHIHKDRRRENSRVVYQCFSYAKNAEIVARKLYGNSTIYLERKRDMVKTMFGF